MTDSLGIVIAFVPLAVAILVIAGVWKTFTKANQPGWAAIIPFYQQWIMVKVSDNEWWWFLLWLFVPLVNIVAHFKISIDVAKNFGRGTGFGIGLALLPFIFFPLLGFGDDRYQGGRRGAGSRM